jgi:hypothetical protein
LAHEKALVKKAKQDDKQYKKSNDEEIPLDPMI